MKKLVLLPLLCFIAQVALAVGIDTTLTLSIGGIEQVVKLKGKDRSKPILLYLHGAGNNGFSLIANANKLTSELQTHFVVALWDQREYGKTAELNKSSKPLTVKLIVEDTKAVIDYLLRKFARQKLYLVGHSMGSLESICIADQYPELLYAVVAMSPPVDGIESQKIGVSILKKHFQKIKNQRAIKELATIKLPARDFESLFIRFVWQTEYEGEAISDTLREQIKPMLKQWMETPAAALSNEVFEMNFFKQFPTLKCPVYVFIGRKDLMTNASLTEKYFKKLKAPKKQLFWFEKSAHGLPDAEPELMQQTIINNLLKNG
jgi:pimeloyl-ACP methyl ester carboxylesterase